MMIAAILVAVSAPALGFLIWKVRGATLNKPEPDNAELGMSGEWPIVK